MCYQRGPYTLTNVFESISEQQREACVDIWLRNKVMPNREAAWQRSAQVCYFITETASRELVGVNTLYKGKVVENGPTRFLNRMFIDPQHRNSRLMITGTAMMLCFAKTQLADRGISGVVNVNENAKLSRPGMRDIFQRLGYQSRGFHNGQEVWFFEFARIQLIKAEPPLQ